MTWIRPLKIAAAAAVLGAIVFVLYMGYARSQTFLLIVGGVLLPIWGALCFFFVWPGDNTRTARRLLRMFTYEVDRARQRHRDNAKLVDEQVVKAFEKLHAEIDRLLRRYRLRMAQLKRAVTNLDSRDAPQGTRWRPPTLMEMGYAVRAADKFQRGASVLALYKLSGETHSRSGAIVNTYTIMKEGVAADFSGKFEAKVLSPHANELSTQGVSHAAIAGDADTTRRDIQPASNADSEHNVGYILSLLGPIEELNHTVVIDNLRSMAALAEDTTETQPLATHSVRGWQRSVLMERIGYLESSLPLARRAIRQEPQLLAAALADLLRDPAKHRGTLAACLTTLTDILQPVSPHSWTELESAFEQFVARVQGLQVLDANYVLENPGMAFVDLRGAEANSALLRRVAELLGAPPPEAGTKIHRLHLFSHLTSQVFQEHLRGFRELNAGAEDQAVIHTLLQSLHEERLVLDCIAGTQPLKAKEFPRPAGHQWQYELFCSANPAGFNLDNLAPQARYVLWTLSGRALHATLEHVQLLLETADVIRGTEVALPAAKVT